jgi:hypothetical protein
MNDDPNLAAVAEEIFSRVSSEASLNSPELGQAVADAWSDARQAIGDPLAVARQLGSDVAELDRKRDLLPDAGWRRLRSEAISQARALGDEADRRAGRAIEALQGELVAAAQPTLDPSREVLARGELEVALGGLTGNLAASRAIELAHTGSRELVAVLGSSFGMTLLQSHGLEGRALTDALASVRQVAAGVAAEHGASVRETLAGKALEKVGGLGAAKGASGTALLFAIDRANR